MESTSDSQTLTFLSAEDFLPQKKDMVALRKSPEGAAVARYVKEQFHKCMTLRAKEEKRWNINLALYSGQQWAETVAPEIQLNTGALLKTPALAKGRERQTINRIKSVCRTEMSKFLSRRPGASVIPSSATDEDQQAAAAGEQAWLSTMERRKLYSEIPKAVFWKVITGNGFIKTYWDDTLVDQDSGMDGDVVYESVDPYKLFFPDLKVEGIQNQAYVINAYTMPTERLKLMYEEELGADGAELKPTCIEASSILETSFANPRSSDEKQYDSNMVYELWIKPGVWKGLRNGGRVVMVEDLIVALDDEGIPYEHGEFPFQHLKHIPTGRFYGSSVIEDLEDLQKDYNKLRSRIAEAIYKMGMPQMTAAKGSVSASRITNEIGLLIEYKLGHQPPQPLPIQQMPAHLQQHLEMILRDFEDLSGQHQVTKGTVPPGVTAAAAISYLQEADDSYLYTSYMNFEEAFQDIAYQTLQLCVQFWDMPRMVKVIGEDQSFSASELSGADIKNGTDIRVEKGSSLPQSKAARQAFVMDLMANQYITPEDGLQMLEIGGASSVLDRVQIDRRQAARENVQFRNLTEQDYMLYNQQWEELTAQGEAPIDPETGDEVRQPPIIPVNSFDNHSVHIDEHNRFRKSQAYLTLPEVTKQALETHVEMHKAYMQADMLQQAMSQIPTDGTVPGVSGLMEGGGEEEMGQEGNPMGGGAEPPASMDTAGTPAAEEPEDPFGGQF
jgi:hypothetical protein